MDKIEWGKEPTGEPSAKKSRQVSAKKESPRIAHLLHQVLDSSTNDDAKEAVSQSNVLSLLQLALMSDDAKEAAS
jgi:hypothetical protein